MKAKKIWKSMLWYNAFFIFLVVVGLIKGGEMYFAYYMLGLSLIMTVAAYLVEVYIERRNRRSG